MDSPTKVWIKICTLEELPTDCASDLTIGGQRLAVVRYGDRVSIFQGFCTHMLFPLAGSSVKDCVLTCSLHQSKFDVRDGSVIDWSHYPKLVGQALAQVRERKALRSYSAKVENGNVYILWAANATGKVSLRLKKPTVAGAA